MKVGQRHYNTIWFKGKTVYLIDQNQLPYRFKIRALNSAEMTVAAIRNMTVRGAGAIGIAAGFAMAQYVIQCPKKLSIDKFFVRIRKGRETIERTRPTARNLFYAVERVEAAARAEASDICKAQKAALNEALLIAKEDEEAAKSIARYGVRLIRNNKDVITHCNAGWLAFSDWGTALAPIYLAKRKGRKFFVYARETRPRLQGARLTAWELGNENVPHAVIVDSAAGSIMQKGRVGLVIVGADRIALNGDTANKIGTYSLAVLAKEHRIPFYVAAPLSTFDMNTKKGSDIKIENRSNAELFGSAWFKKLKKTLVKNPAFDVTPARYIKGIITERGIIRPNSKSIRRALKVKRA